MAEFFRTSQVWVVDFQYEGSPRTWLKAFPAGEDVHAAMTATLRGLYGDRARLVGLREADAEEEGRYLRGELPTHAYCPTGR